MKNSLVWLTAGALLLPRPGFAADLRLKYAIIITRHGVRSPTWDANRLSQYSAEPWPDFGVPPGDLTPHGLRAMELMGTYYRSWLSQERLIDPKTCRDASRITIYANKNQRTVETGRALAGTLLPGCGIKTASQRRFRCSFYGNVHAGPGTISASGAGAPRSGFAPPPPRGLRGSSIRTRPREE